MLMPGAWVREPCLHRWYLGGASQPNRPWQAVAGSERGQSQPPRRAVRSTHEPVFWWHCHCRITESRQWLTWPLRTQVWASLFSRSRPLGPMLPASARALWPFFVRSARPARHRVPGSPRAWFAGSSGVRSPVTTCVLTSTGDTAVHAKYMYQKFRSAWCFQPAIV